MKDRMSKWSGACSVLGWICVIGGIVVAFFTRGLTLVAVPVGIMLLLNAAIFEWMDGITDRLIKSMEIQERQTSVLDQMERRMRDISSSECTTVRGDFDSSTSSDRPTEQAVVEQAKQGYDAQNMADIYRLSQKLRK